MTDPTENPALQFMSEDEALGYVVRRLANGARKRSVTGFGAVAVFHVSTETGVCHVALDMREMLHTTEANVDELVRMKLDILDRIIEYGEY